MFDDRKLYKFSDFVRKNVKNCLNRKIYWFGDVSAYSTFRPMTRDLSAYLLRDASAYGQARLGLWVIWVKSRPQSPDRKFFLKIKNVQKLIIHV